MAKHGICGATSKISPGSALDLCGAPAPWYSTMEGSRVKLILAANLEPQGLQGSDQSWYPKWIIEIIRNSSMFLYVFGDVHSSILDILDHPFVGIVKELTIYGFSTNGWEWKILELRNYSWVEKKPVCKSWSQKQIMWFPSGGLHIYVSALDSELFELELVASTSELLSATSYP